MFHKILVAIDSSENSQLVFDEARSLARTAGAGLMLLHVLSHEEKGSPDFSFVGLEYYPTIANELVEMHQKQWADYKDRSLEMLRSYVEQASADGVTAEFTQSVGSPGRIICELSRTWQAELIIMGRRGHSGLNELLLGSVSNYVLHHAPCSVLTVQGETGADSGIVQEQQAATVL
jgi:nucleotide-binding universal stress UspA family protein